MIRISIIEDDSLFRETLFKKLYTIPEYQNIEVFGSAEEFWRSPRRKETDLALIDVNLPQMSGIDLSGLLEVHHPEIQKIIISSLKTERVITEAIENGCKGYILKVELHDIIQAVQTVLEGGAMISPGIAIRVLSFFRKKGGVDHSEAARLSPREQQIIELMASGKKPAAVASILDVSVNTVRSQIRSIYKKLAIHNQQELIQKAARLGFLSKGEEENREDPNVHNKQLEPGHKEQMEREHEQP